MQHLYTDEWIGKTVELHTVYKHADIPCVSAATMYSRMAEMRDDYEAELARLRVPDNRPRPDWSKAPDGANWWACDADGWSYWYENKPEILSVNAEIRGVQWGESDGLTSGLYGVVEIPLGVDWRLLRERRPEPQS